MPNKNYILIVEDSQTQAMELIHILEGNGYTVEKAGNGIEAMEKVRESLPSLIVSDIVMPEMDGYQLCTVLKNDDVYKEIPFVLLTSLSDPKDVIKGLQAGADNFLTKPYSEKFLLSRIQYILANRELRKTYTSGMGIEIVFGGQNYFISSDRIQILDLLLSTYENAIQKNSELFEANQNLTEMRDELERKNFELQKLNMEKNKFLGMAAHDIRNPAGNILAYSMIVKDEIGPQIPEEYLEMITVIKDSSEFILSLLNELLDISIIESGKLLLNLSEMDICKVIERNLSLNKATAEKKRITLSFNYKGGIPTLTADKTKIDQVLNNLISNAIKFSHEASKVSISAELLNQNILLLIKDEGQGIPEKEMDKLFKPFSRISVRSTAGERSTGLGLSIVKKIIDAHKGKVWVESEVGKGTTFFIEIPVEQNT